MQQKYLKNAGLITLISILSMIPPLSTDLYMPALPDMTVYFNTTSTLMSFTMTIFFIFMAIGILILGPMSDKYGRKPVLIASISISMIFSARSGIRPRGHEKPEGVPAADAGLVRWEYLHTYRAASAVFTQRR